MAWSGSQAHVDDLNRSMTLDKLLPLLGLPVEFHCLQKEVREEDQPLLQQVFGVRTYMDALDDFADTAALIAAMDLVISVDTSVVHLAGALAKPVWVMLPYAPDYRWLLDRTDSPWYPTATLFRQPAPQDWDAVIADVLRKLEPVSAAS